MKRISCFVIFFSAFHALAQNRFSQFYSSPLQYNPANTGKFDGRFRAGGHFRNEINASNQFYSINSFFADFKALKSLTPENDHFGIGFFGMHENSLKGGIKTDQFSMSLAYQKGLDEDGAHQLSLGFQGSYNHKQIEPPTYIYEADLLNWAQGGFTNLHLSGDNRFEVQYFDLNVGLVYSGPINEENLFSLGLSVFHANKPSKTFQGGEFNLERQPLGHVSWEKILPGNRRIYTATLLSFLNNSFDEVIFGSMYQMNIGETYNKLHFGTWLRHNQRKGNAIIPAVGLTFNNFTLNLSYDIGVSSALTSQRSAGEVSLIYKK